MEQKEAEKNTEEQTEETETTATQRQQKQKKREGKLIFPFFIFIQAIFLFIYQFIIIYKAYSFRCSIQFSNRHSQLRTQLQKFSSG